MDTVDIEEEVDNAIEVAGQQLRESLATPAPCGSS